jgi:hypothetical protein
MFEHVGLQHGLGVCVDAADRLHGDSPADLLPVGVPTAFLEATDPNPTARMVGGVVGGRDGLANSGPELFEGEKDLRKRHEL